MSTATRPSFVTGAVTMAYISVGIVAASWTAVALGATSLAGLAVYRDSVFVAFAAVPLLLVPLPAVAAVLAGTRDVKDWLTFRN